MAAPQVCKRLDAILKFMEPYWPWANCHMVNFITDNHWDTFVPLDIRREIGGSKDIEDCIQSVFWSEACENKRFPESSKFVKCSRNHGIEKFEDILIEKEDFEQSCLAIAEKKKHRQIIIKEFLSEKKRHEVEITAKLINDLIGATIGESTDTVIVDAGDGKGYLSSRLSLEYGHKVLGIDSNTSNTVNALERNKKLKKAWNGLVERADLESRGITPLRKGRTKRYDQQPGKDNHSVENDKYKTVEKFITSDLDLLQLINDYFSNLKSSPPAVCLTGLHTCGNLAATCLKLYHYQANCKILCNIGCCYHLLKEMYSGQEFYGNRYISNINQENGFPLSNYLQHKCVRMGRNARMLAVQSVERTKSARELPSITLFYRALFEVLVCELDIKLKDTIQVGKIKKFNSFEEYVELCLKKYPQLQFSKERINAVEKEYEDFKNYLDIFYLLRMSFAPVVESLILLDRLLFLLENGYNKSYIIPAFDAVISPRRFAIISIKE